MMKERQEGSMVKEAVFIQAGGKSRRMGSHKALLQLGEKRVIDHLIERFSCEFDEVVLVTNDPELYMDVNVPIISDDPSYKNCGPLAGMYRAFEATDAEMILSVACDMPFASPALGRWLLDVLQERNTEAVVPRHNGFIHPLFAVYRTRGRGKEKMKQLLDNQQYAIKDYLDGVHDTIVEEIEAPGDLKKWDRFLWNMNDPNAYEEAKEMWKNHERGGGN
jgi:molybdopterin-guanine dinucleotide biosynthesis protein A